MRKDILPRLDDMTGKYKVPDIAKAIETIHEAMREDPHRISGLQDKVRAGWHDTVCLFQKETDERQAKHPTTLIARRRGFGRTTTLRITGNHDGSTVTSVSYTSMKNLLGIRSIEEAEIQMTSGTIDNVSYSKSKAKRGEELPETPDIYVSFGNPHQE